MLERLSKEHCRCYMEYRYSILRYQPTLERTERQAFAVMVESKLPTGGVVFLVGRVPQIPETASDVGKAVAKNMPDLLQKLVSDAVENRARGEDVLDWISRHMHWNFQSTLPDTHEDRDSSVAEVAYKLFARYVAGADELVEYASKASSGMIRPPDTMQRLGQTIQTAVAVPATWHASSSSADAPLVI